MSGYEGMPFQIPPLELNMSKVGSMKAVGAHISARASLDVHVGQGVTQRTRLACAIHWYAAQLRDTLVTVVSL